MIVSIRVLAYSKPQIEPPVAFRRDTQASNDQEDQPCQEAVTGVTYPDLAITYESVEKISLRSLLEKMARAIDPSASVDIFGDGIYWKQFEIEVSEEIYNDVGLRKRLLEQAHEVLAPYVRSCL